MLKETELLNLVRKCTEIGTDSIKIILDDIENIDFYNELKRELDEYNEIYHIADNTLLSIGGIPEDVKAAAKIASHLSGKIKALSGSISKISEDMIRDKTQAVTKIVKELNSYNGEHTVKTIAERLLNFEEGNIEKLKTFL